MAIKFEKIQPGMVLYDRRKGRMGNTMLRSISEWEVRVLSVDVENRVAMVTWNGNPRREYHEAELTRLSRWSMFDEDVTVTRGTMGAITDVRKKPRTSVAAARAKR